MDSLARTLMAVGAALLVAGLALHLLGRAGLPLGRLPGDLAWRGRNVRVYFPLGTSLLLSVLLSLLFYLLGRFRR